MSPLDQIDHNGSYNNRPQQGHGLKKMTPRVLRPQSAARLRAARISAVSGATGAILRTVGRRLSKK